MTDDYGSITIPDFLVSHFRSSTHLIRVLAATALSLFVIIYVSAQIDITGKTFESFLGFNYYTGIAIGFGIVVLYIFSGGFLAVAWSDFFQGALMFVGLLMLPIVAYFHSSFRMASVSKQFFAAAILICQEMGLLTVKDPITNYISNKHLTGITIENLVHHTSGIADYYGEAFKTWDSRWNRNNADIINFFKESYPEPYFRPGEKYQYCNPGSG